VAPLGVDSTQVADAPPPLTEQMRAELAASFPFRPSDAGSVGALTQTAAGALSVAPRRRWWWAAAAGCAVLALSVTWWRLREPTPAPIADTAPLVEPARVAVPAAEHTVAHSLQPEGATGQLPSSAPPAVTVQLPTPPAAQPRSIPKAAVDAPTVRPINISPVPAAAPAEKKPAAPSSPLVAPHPPRRGSSTDQSATQQSASTKSASTKSAPSKSAPGKSEASKSAAPAKSPPGKSSPPAGENAAELQRRLGF
jgi:hypothetical protein